MPKVIRQFSKADIEEYDGKFLLEKLNTALRKLTAGAIGSVCLELAGSAELTSFHCTQQMMFSSFISDEKTFHSRLKNQGQSYLEWFLILEKIVLMIIPTTSELEF